MTCPDVGLVSCSLCTVFVNPRCACAARVMVVIVSVCLSVKSHLTLEASFCPENAVTYSAGNEGQNICGAFLKLLRCRDQALPRFDSYTYDRSFCLLITCMRICKFSKVCDVMLGLHAVSSPCVLYYSSTMIILGLENCVSCWSSVCTQDCSPAI